MSPSQGRRKVYEMMWDGACACVGMRASGRYCRRWPKLGEIPQAATFGNENGWRKIGLVFEVALPTFFFFFFCRHNYTKSRRMHSRNLNSCHAAMRGIFRKSFVQQKSSSWKCEWPIVLCTYQLQAPGYPPPPPFLEGHGGFDRFVLLGSTRGWGIWH